MTKSGNSTNVVVCRYCGLEAAGSRNHGSAAECVAALQSEVSRLRRQLPPEELDMTSRAGPAESTSADGSPAVTCPAEDLAVESRTALE